MINQVDLGEDSLGGVLSMRRGEGDERVVELGFHGQDTVRGAGDPARILFGILRGSGGIERRELRDIMNANIEQWARSQWWKMIGGERLEERIGQRC